jgi:large subunit ribosomal protein L32
MAVPKRRTSKMKKRQRKAGRKTVVPGISEDKQQGGGFHLPHRVCPETGMYRGRQVISISADE